MTHPLVNLVEDIYGVLSKPEQGLVTDETVLGRNFGKVLSERINPRVPGEGGISRRGTLRLSNLGTNCDRALWFRVNNPEVGTPLAPSTLFKFLFGDTVELLLLEYARKAGYRVEGEQTKLEVQGVVGHRDAVINGMVVDCKSASSASFNKFRAGLQAESDSFGYLTQLKSYLVASREDPIVHEKNKAAFLVVDKQYGDICLDVHTFTEEELQEVYSIADRKKTLVGASTPAEAPYVSRTVKTGKHAGKKKLDVACTYCDFKHQCYSRLYKDESTSFEAWYEVEGPATGDMF